MKHTAQKLVALSPVMKPDAALRLLERTLAADPAKVRAVLYDLTGSTSKALSEPTPLENISTALYGADITVTVEGITTHMFYYVNTENDTGEGDDIGALLRRGLEHNWRVSPGDPYKLEISFS